MEQMQNALLRRSKIALQLSLKEGFEFKVTEALMKGKPVVAYASGGIPLQIVDGRSGYLVPTGETEKVAEKLFGLLTNERLYQKMSREAVKLADRKVLTIANAINWLFLGSELVRKDRILGKGRMVAEMVS